MRSSTTCGTAALRERLHPEWPIYSFVAGEHSQTALAEGSTQLLSTATDPMVLSSGRATSILVRRRCAAMQASSKTLFGPRPQRGALVYMTAGSVHWVFLAPAI